MTLVRVLPRDSRERLPVEPPGDLTLTKVRSALDREERGELEIVTYEGDFRSRGRYQAVSAIRSSELLRRGGQSDSADEVFDARRERRGPRRT